MFNEIPLETLVFTRERILTELEAGIADDSVRRQYERVGLVLDTRIAELGGAVIAVSEEVPEVTEQEPATEVDVPVVAMPEEEVVVPVVQEAEIAVAELPEPVSEEVPVVDEPQPVQAELSPVVESGRTWVDFAKRTKSGRRIITPEELEILRLKEAIRKARRQDEPTIIRFDPELGAYDRSGKMYADSTESPAIKRNLQAVVEVCSLLADLSHIGMQRGMVFTTDELLSELGMSDLGSESRRALFHEVKRLLSPSKVLMLTNNLEEGSSVSVLQEFSFVMTELVAREGKVPKRGYKDTQSIDVGFVGMQDSDCDTDAIRKMMFAKKVPRPKNHKQAVALLDALMHDAADFFDDLETRTGTEHAQMVKDLAHIFVQQELGWNAYFAARNGRMIRSGNQGFTSVVRQVTGSQQNERFQREAGAETHKRKD